MRDLALEIEASINVINWEKFGRFFAERTFRFFFRRYTVTRCALIGLIISFLINYQFEARALRKIAYTPSVYIYAPTNLINQGKTTSCTLAGYHYSRYK